jgi:hypothetical protein
MTGRRALVVVAIVTAAVTSSCAFGTARFARDTRLDIVSPSDGASVTLPLTVKLSIKNLDVGPPGSDSKYFVGVFVDQSPIRPKDSLIAKVDEQCRRSGNGCANTDYFAGRNIYLTGSTSVRIPAVPQTAEHRKAAQVHRIYAVLIDNKTNRRVGETLAVSHFRVKAAL